VACTIDHGLRAESAREAKAAGAMARKLKVTHRIVPWRGKKPAGGLQQAARRARYRLLAETAASAKARHVVAAHTLDDQAETILLRLTRGSGLTGLTGMARMSAWPVEMQTECVLVRPFLSLPKSRLLATLRKAKIGFAQDPSNTSERFTRVRMRGIAPALEKEGLSAQRLSLLARRLRRADAALELMVEAAARLARKAEGPRAGISYDMAQIARLPDEVVLRLIGRTIGVVGNEGPVELGKLESLWADLSRPAGGRRTLAGAIVTVRRGALTIECAPARKPRRAGFRP
jgi:tRNA(Ile)-lysidine synthase